MDVLPTDQQRAKVNQVKDRLFATFRDVHSGPQKIRSAALAQWRSANPNAKALHELVDRRSAEYQKAMHGVVDGMREVHATLTPAQREEIAMVE